MNIFVYIYLLLKFMHIPIIYIYIHFFKYIYVYIYIYIYIYNALSFIYIIYAFCIKDRIIPKTRWEHLECRFCFHTFFKFIPILKNARNAHTHTINIQTPFSTFPNEGIIPGNSNIKFVRIRTLKCLYL